MNPIKGECHPERSVCLRKANANVQSKDPYVLRQTRGVRILGGAALPALQLGFRLEVWALAPEVRVMPAALRPAPATPRRSAPTRL
jgi:hypothetical protein